MRAPAQITEHFVHQRYDQRLVISGVKVGPGKMRAIFGLIADSRLLKGEGQCLVDFIDIKIDRLLTDFKLNIRFSRVHGSTIINLDEEWLKALKSICAES